MVSRFQAWRKPVLWAGITFLVMLACFGPTDNWRWDPSYYYAQLRSPVVENDLDFRNETITGDIVTAYTATGLQNSSWPVGPSILWSPFFFLAHGLVLLISPAKATGFTFPYITLVTLGSALYGLAGVWILYQISRRWAAPWLAGLTAFLCLGATPLVFYVFRQPIMAHSTSLLVTAAMFWFYLRLVEDRFCEKYSGLIWGVLLGLSFLTRWSGLIYAILPAAYYTLRLIPMVRQKDWAALRGLLGQVGVLVLSLIVTITPQLALWQRLHGTWLTFPQAANPRAYVDSVLPLNTLRAFFSTARGLLFWSPFMLIGMIGAVRIPNREIRGTVLMYLLAHGILIGYRTDWYGGGGFGPRYFIEALPLIATGFACLFKDVAGRVGLKRAIHIGALLLFIHHSVLIYAVEHGSDGWFDLGARDREIGVLWQWQAFLRLLQAPQLWLEPRLYVGEGRQVVLVNLAQGVRNIVSYRVPGLAALLASGLVFGASLLGSRLRKAPLWLSWPNVTAGAALYMFIWAIFYLLVG